MASFARLLFGLGATAFAVTASHSALATNYSYQEVAVPESYSTSVTGLADDGTVIGYYWDINFRTRGFSMKNGVYSTIDGPGLPATTIMGINNKGDVVGYYSETSSDHGLLLRRGTLTTINYPKASATELVAVNDAGVVAGLWFDEVGRPHPFLDDHGVMTAIRVNTAGTQHVAINAKGIVAATMKRNGTYFGYRFKAGHVAAIRIPGAVDTGAGAINSHGMIVGTYSTAGSPIKHGYMLDGHALSTIDYPGATTTNLLAINAASVIAGYGADAMFENLTAFSYSAGVFSPVRPPAATGNVVPVASNASGQILGEDVEGSSLGAFLATPAD